MRKYTKVILSSSALCPLKLECKQANPVWKAFRYFLPVDKWCHLQPEFATMEMGNRAGEEQPDHKLCNV